LTSLTRRLDALLYPGVEDHWDDRAFRERILDHLSQQAMEVLELGAGAGVVEQMDFREEAARVCGIDPDERVVRNPHLDEAKVGVGEAIPYPDASFDLVFACNVLEHLERPRAVFQEVRRVLRPGGVFLAKTPNRWHYVPLIASLTPHGFHEWVNRLRGREEGDTFPTLYRDRLLGGRDRTTRGTSRVPADHAPELSGGVDVRAGGQPRASVEPFSGGVDGGASEVKLPGLEDSFGLNRGSCIQPLRRA